VTVAARPAVLSLGSHVSGAHGQVRQAVPSQSAVAALAAWAEWGAVTPGLTAQQREICDGPPTTYVRQKEVVVGGQRFITAPDASLENLKGTRNAVIMQGVRSSADPLQFGLLREV
jgi:hypothetical protein